MSQRQVQRFSGIERALRGRHGQAKATQQLDLPHRQRVQCLRVQCRSD